jgi:hypothetical protein
MANRPCKPDADFKRLWRLLMPNTPFPACGTPEAGDAPPGTDRPETNTDSGRPVHDETRRG